MREVEELDASIARKATSALLIEKGTWRTLSGALHSLPALSVFPASHGLVVRALGKVIHTHGTQSSNSMK